MPEVQQQGQGSMNANMVRLMHDPRNEETIKFLLNAEKLINDKLMNFAGYFYDPKTSIYKKPEEKDEEELKKQGIVPKLNKVGVSFLHREFMHFQNKFAITANLTKEQISLIQLSYCSRLRKVMLANRVKFGINIAQDMNEIKNAIAETAFITLSQSSDDKGRGFVYSPIKQTETYAYRADEKPQKTRMW